MIFDIDNWREIGATLARNKTRTFLTAFGIFWGTAMLALLMGGAKGLEEILRSNFAGFATNSALLFPDRTTMPYKGYQKGMAWRMNTLDIDNLERLIPGIEAVSPINMQSSTAKYRDKSYSASLQALRPNYTLISEPIMVSGRWINDADMAKRSKVCVLGTNTAANLFGTDDPMGKFVEVDNVYYRVIGVAKQRNEISMGAKIDDSVIVPETTGRQLYNLGNDVYAAMLVVKDGYSPTQLKAAIFRVLRINHPLHPNDTGCMFFMDVSEEFKQVDTLFLGVNILLLFVGLSSLIAGVIGVGNIMWIIVKERTKEFGIRRAIGAKPRAIMSQIMLESAILTTVAGIAGICFAVGVLQIADYVVKQQIENLSGNVFQLTFGAAVLIMVLFLTLGSAAGAIPALKAMKIKPIEALNDK